MKATILGASGFIGTALNCHLRTHGYEVHTPARAELGGLKGDLGAVFYCIGMTGNFRAYPRETVEAQVSLLSDILFRQQFSSFVYLSSTRVYGTDAQEGPMDESQPLAVLPSADSTYDLAKLLGEALCAAHKGPHLISARLSNVYGLGMSQNTFLGSVLSSLVQDGHVEIGEDPASAKDYVSIDDVVTALETLSRQGESGCYNIASGALTSHAEIAQQLQAEGYDIRFRPGGAVRRFPQISVDKLRRFCEVRPQGLCGDLTNLISSMKTSH